MSLGDAVDTRESGVAAGVVSSDSAVIYIENISIKRYRQKV